MPSSPEILVIRFSSLGDVVLASAALRAIARAIPDAKLTLATKSAYQPLFENFEADVKVEPYHPGQSLLDYRNRLSHLRFNHIIDLHGSIRSLLLSSMLGADHRARIRKHAARRRVMVRRKLGLDHPLSALRACMEALAAIAPNSDDIYPKLFLSTEEQERVTHLRIEHPYVIGIGWGAHWATKMVPPHVWSGVLARLDQQVPMTLRLFGLESDRQAMETFLKEWRTSHPRVEMMIECGHSLREVMVKLASNTVFVSSDSGLMHLAAALGVPSLGLFGPTHPALGFGPVGPGSRAFHAGTYCSPCHRHGAAPCFRERRYCFDELDLEDIAASIRDVMASATRPVTGGQDA